MKRLFVSGLLLCLTACTANSPPSALKAASPNPFLSPVVHTHKASPTPKPSPAASIFADPEKVCNAMAGFQLPAQPNGQGQIWFPGSTGQTGAYACASDDLVVTPGGYFYAGDLPNTIAYTAESKTQAKVEDVRLTLSELNEARKKTAVQQFVKLELALLRELSLTPSTELLQAIKASQPGKFHEHFGEVDLDHSKAGIGYFWSLTLKPQA